MYSKATCLICGLASHTTGRLLNTKNFKQLFTRCLKPFFNLRFLATRLRNSVRSTSVSFMPGFILDTAAAVGDIVVNCSSVSTDVELTGPRQSESTAHIIKGPSVKKNANLLNLSTTQKSLQIS